MADIKTNQSKVYNALKGMGFSGIGANEQDFAAKMSNPKNREKVYKALTSKGYKGIGKDQAAFDSLIYQSQQPAGTGRQSISPYLTGQQVSESTAAQNLEARMPERFESTFDPNAVVKPKQEAKPVQQATAPTKPQAQPKQQKPQGLTWQEQMAMGMNAGSAMNTAGNATKGVETLGEAAKQASPFGGTAGIGNNKNLRKGKQTFDAEKGAFVDTYLTSDGREFRDIQQANGVQAELDNSADEIRYREAMKSLGMGDLSAEKDKPIDQRLKEAYAERMELQRQLSEVGKKESAARKSPRFPSMVGGPAQTYTMSDESKNLSSALRLLERRITALEAERDDEGQSMFWRGTADTLKDPSAYSLGLTDLADTGVMSQLKSKLDAANGDVSRLSDSEKALVRNYMMNQEAQRLNENRGNMYGFGQMFGQSLPFMAEFYLTGGFAGLGSAGTRLGTKAGLKMAGSEIGKQMTKNLGGRILLKTGQSVLKGTGRVGGALAGGALQSNTIGAAKTYSDIANRNMGNLTLDDKGNLDFKDGEGIAEAFLKGQLTNAFENGSELLGPAFDFAPNYLARVIKNKVAGGAINKMLSNKVWRGTNNVLKKFGVQGLFGEGMEEEANNIGNVLIGESSWFKDPNDPNKPAFFDGEEQFKTWAGVALTGAVLRGPALAAGGYQKAQYYANKYNLNSSENQMRFALGDYDRYENIKAMLDGATNENIGNVLNSIVRGGQLNNQEKEAVVMYAQDLVKLRGFNIGSVVAEAVGATPKPQVSNYNIRGLHVDEVDKDGNVLASHDYENADDLKAGLYELQQQRFDDNLQSDISIMKTRPSAQYNQLVVDYLTQSNPDMLPSEFEAILAKPSMERTEEEQQLVAPFADLLHNAVYDNTMLHEEQSQQDGEEIADADSIDMESGNEQGAVINSQWLGAQDNRRRLFEQDENLKQEVELMESQGLSHQEIISRLDWARPEQVQGMTDYYNTKAKYEGYINRKAQKINEEAANSRQRHTMKGTINGVADLNNVHTITDGTNRYFLVSGDVTTDPATGRITGSNSGLIIGMDLDGSFVNISDASGYSVEPVTMSLDQFEEAERARLGQQVTQAIDPNQTMNPAGEPQVTVEQGGNQDNAGGEAGVNGDTGANEPPAPAPAAVTQQPTQQPQQPAVPIENVTDKDGIKRYENGIAVDDAIADIQNDGFDVNEISDASIAEAQEVIDKINNKQVKTRLDIEKRKKAQDVIDYYNNVKARWAEMNAEAQPAESEENVNVHPEQPVIEEKPVSSQQNLTVEEQKQQRIAEAKAKYGELFDADFTKANDVYELVSMWVGRNRNLAWDDVNGKRGLQKELGWTRKIGGDTKFIETLLAKKGEGMGVDEFVHMVWESPENDIMGEKRFSTDEIKEALLDLLKSARSKSDVVDYALNTRIAQAEAAWQERQNMDEEQPDQAEIEPLTDEEIQAMEANLPFAMSTDKGNIVELLDAIDELSQQKGMPEIQLVDTDFMSEEDWYDLTSRLNDDSFVSQEQIDETRSHVLADGLYIVEETGDITVYSDSQTAEELKQKVEYIRQNYGRSNEEETGGLEAQDLQRPETRVVAEAQGEDAENVYTVSVQRKGVDREDGSRGQGAQGAGLPDSRERTGANGLQYSENQGRSETQNRGTEERAVISEGSIGESQSSAEGQGSHAAVDEYLQPRNAEEEQIIADIDKELQGEIFAQQLEVGKAKSDLRKAQARESDRATDLFGNDNTLNQEGQLFDNSDMPVDQSMEGVERRTAAQREKLQEAQNKLNRLQSPEERNSRIRGALDNYRRQTTFETNDPIEAINQAAQQFQQEQEENAYGADNKLITQDRYEELKKRMKQKLLGQANMGFDPEIMQIGAEMAMFHIEAGAHKFADYATRMINDLGDAIRPYLQSFYEAARRMPGMEELRKEMDSTETVDNFDVLSYDKQNDNTVNVNKKENNEPENVVSSQQKPASELEGDSAEFVERQKKIDNLSKTINEALFNAVMKGDVKLKTMQSVKALASEYGLDDMSRTDLQELVEAEIVNVARDIAQTEAYNDEQKFEQIKRLYERQPTLSARDNDRINKQQYSTPAPMAFLMGKFLTDGKPLKTWGLEPSAGNGMLTINLPKERMHVNDIDEMRLYNLQKQGFGQVTSQDGLQPFEQKAYDVVVTNPPFGNVTPKVYDGIYEISGLEHQMAINALESMNDDGRAAIIIGGNTEYNTNGTIKGKDRAFLNYLYAHYNVVDVINMNGHELYSRQGTGFPVRMILINGRKEFNPRSFAPTIQKARAERVNSYDELYKRVNDDILSDSNKSAGVHNAESGESNGKHDNGHAGASTETGVRELSDRGSTGEPSILVTNGRGVQRVSDTAQPEGRGTTNGEGTGVVGKRVSVLHTSGKETTQHEGSETSSAEPGGRGRSVASGGVDSERQSGESDVPVGVGQRGTGTAQQDEQPTVKRELTTEKVPYKKQSSNPFTLDSLMPAEQADEVKKILEELGDVDQFLVDELGYSSKEELHQALAAEQIDSVAMAIHQMNQGNAFIIGDMTGIGKGRQAAALIRYGVKKGGCPVFITVKKGLFSDMYRDLCDIGSPELKPFIWCAKDKDKSQDITDADGNVVYKWSEKEQKRVAEYILKNGKLPPEYDYIVTTYDGFKSGTLDYENGQKKARNFGKGKSAGSMAINGQTKRDALEMLARNSYVIMDESHNAGGDKSNVSKFLQYITAITKGTTFLSATFAKRPENMPIYALRTAISKAGVKVDELIAAVKKGGATFQEVMSKALTGAGQMIRRERNMEGVTIDWKGIEDEDIIQKQREQYDTVIGLFNDIIQFQRSYVDPIVNGMNDAAAEEQGEVDHTPGTRDMGINNTPFASRTYNMVQQVLLSLKAEEAGKRAVEHLKAGRKPVIAVANTNEGAADEAVGMSEEDLEMPDLSINLKKGLQGTLRITKKDAFGNETNEMIPFERLSEEGQRRYAEIMDAIESASSGLSLSPIDVIKNELKKAGYKVGELTGRKAEFVYNSDGTVKRVKRTDTDKKKTAANFNNGTLDALIINRSAGTGISLHASSRFKDQRQRIMVVAQAQGDVNDEVQMRGRIDRTGQVLRGMYEYVVSQIPSEQRLLMMLKAKLRSLDANTTSSQKSKFNEMQVQDIINKYGDDIVIQYLSEHPDLAVKMVDPLKWGDSLGDGYENMPPETLVTNAKKQDEQGQTASKVLGRMALLTVKEQEKMLKEIGDLYQAEIDRLNEMGENDLEITEMPLKAKTLKKDVWEEGVEPGGKNPFADNSYVEEVEMDVLKKPMKAEEVKKSQERLLGGKTWDEYKQEQLDKIENWAEQKKEETRKTFTERAEKKATAEKEKYAKGAKKAQEKNGMTDAEIEKNAGYQYDTFYKQEMEKLDNALAAIDKQKQVFVDALDTFTTDGVYALPTDIYDLSQLTFEPSFGKVIDINIKEDNYSTTASTITFATLDGRRKITIPISGMVKQNNGEKRDIKPIVVQQTAQTRSGFFGSNIANMLKVLEQNIDNWDKLTSTATRKKGYIITGNLLKALTSLRSQNKGGKLISYTTDTGDVRQGILMSDQFEPGSLTSKNPISSAKKDLDDWEKDYKIVSADGDVTVKRGRYDLRNNTYDYTLQVPKSKKRGDKYFNDKTLLGLMDGQFEGSSKMSADFSASNLDSVLKRLDELGVTVESAKEDKLDTSDPMQAINQAANSWRRSAKESESSLSGSSDVSESGKKSVPLERRTLKSYTDKDGNYHKGIEEELRDLESEISRRSSGESEEGGSKVDGSSRVTGRRGVSDLRREAAKLRAEIARRDQKKQDLRQKYNIDENGNISLSDLRRMFHDLNSNKILGKLFDKVCNILEKIGTQFRFTDKLEALTAGEAFGFFNTTFFNWDSFTRDRTDQENAKTILHEVIHNIANQLLDRYTRTDLPSSVPELTDAQKKLAKEILDIYDVVDKAIPAGKNGEREFYGATDAYEMLSEMANPDFREKLSTIPYRKGMNVLQKLVEWFKDVLGAFGFDYKGNTAFDSLNKALEDVIGNYDGEGIREYRKILAKPVRELRAVGLNEDIIDYVERYELNGGGTASKVEDKELIKKLEAEPKIKVYRAMQLQNGKLYPPMAAKVNGKWQDPLPLGEWSQADEHPELVDKNGKFTLDKGNGKTVAGVVYAPYMHGSTTMLNDQFKEAQDRPELVVVEAEMPASELTSGYQAEKSPRKVGMLDWKAGTIQGQLTGTRRVMLSRWVKPIRIVPSSEVAASIKEMIDGQVDVMPTNVVTPEQREELEKLGVKFVKTDNKEIIQDGEHKGEQYSDAYGKKSKKKAKKEAPVDGDPMEAIKKAASKWARSKAERDGETPVAHSAKAVYDERLNRVETVFTEAYQDSMIALKTAQNAIAHDKAIPDSQNAYMAENLMHGKNKNEQDLFNRMFRDPMIATINKIMNLTGMNWGDVDRYVYTKSGLERNREFFVRDWLEAERNKTIRRYEDLNDAEQSIFDMYAARIEEDFDDGVIATEEEKNKKLAQALQDAHDEYVNQIEQEYLSEKSSRYQDMQDGMITFPDYLNAIDNFIRRTIDYSYDPSEHDYSGFRAMFGDESGRYNEAAIIEELMETEDSINSSDDDAEKSTTDTLWEQINAATRYGLERYRESGMRSDEQIDRVEQMFHFYVPMRGFKEDRGEDMYQYFTSSGEPKSTVGGLLRHAKGRGSEANFPISTIFAMTYKAISDCNQNLVNQKLYRLCQANPNDLVVLSDSWAVLNELTGEWEETAPDIPEDASEEEVREITLAWEEQMQELALENKAKKIKGKAEFDYKPMDKKKQSEHIIDVRINGQPKKMIVTGNPRMAQALNGQLRFETKYFGQWMQKIKNIMASLFTSYSPTFALRNMFRDWTHFRMMLGVREGHGYASQANKYYRQSLFKMVGLFKKYREGTLNENSEMERDFKDFMDNGGITGFVFMQKIDDIQKEMENIYKKQKAGKPIRLNNKLWEYTLGAIEAVNEGIENNARFATYRASRHYAGRTKARSAYDAKEITVNFNRKGAGSKTAGFKSQSKVVEDAAKAFGVTSQILGEGRIFFNATVQAIATTFKNFQKPDGSLNKAYIAKWAAKYAIPPFMFGLLLPAINKALANAFGGGDDDDPYANLPEWTRRKNLCFYIGNDNFITIPIGQELAAFLSMGDIVAGNTYAPELKPVNRNIGDEMVDVMNTFSPVDISTKITKGGLMEDPISEVTGRTFSVLAPLVAVEQNLGWTGRPIYREDKFQNDQYTPEYQMVYQSTNPVLVNASEQLHKLGGGDDITRGKLEVNPAIIQYLWEQYTGGPGKVFSNTISIGKDAKDILSGKESDFNIRKVEGLKAFVQQGDDRTAYYRTQAKYRKYKEDAEKLYHDVKGYESDAANNPMSLLKLEEIAKSNDFVRMQILREADKELSKINKAANKAEGSDRKELRRLYNQQVKAVVDMLDEVGE